MKRDHFANEQIIVILTEHGAGMPVSELCRKHDISDASIYEWKAKFGGMDVSEAKRLKTRAHDGRRFGYRRLHRKLQWATSAELAQNHRPAT